MMNEEKREKIKKPMQ